MTLLLRYVATVIVLLGVLTACVGTPPPQPDSRQFTGLLKKGQAYLQRGNPRMALLALQKAEALRPDSVELLSQLGVAYDQVGQSGAALKAWRRAHELQPADGAISHNLGVALMRQQQLDGAERAFADALADPKFRDRGETHYNLALIQQRRGAIREMVAKLEKVLQIDPEHVPALQLLADHYHKMRRPDLEEKHLRNILLVESQEIAIIERLANLYLDAGQKGLALPMLEQIQTIAPASAAAKRAKLRQEELF